jgi:hypothetical protein
MKPRAEVAKWQTQLTQNQPGRKPRVGSSPTFGSTFGDLTKTICGNKIGRRDGLMTLGLVRTFHCSSFFNFCLRFFYLALMFVRVRARQVSWLRAQWCE